MNRSIFAFVAAAFMLLSLSFSNANAQDPCLDTTQCETLVMDWHNDCFDLGENCEICADVRVWCCNGELKYEYKDLSWDDNCIGMREDFGIYHHYINSIHEVYDVLLLEHLRDMGHLDDCGEFPSEVRKIYSAACGIWVSCTYQVEALGMQCEKGYDPLPDPDPDEITIWKWQPCGETCCERVYTIHEEVDPHGGGTILVIDNMQRNQIAPCDQDPAPDGDDTYGKPCQSGC